MHGTAQLESTDGVQVATIPSWVVRHGAWIAALAAVITYLNVLPNDYSNDGIPIVRQSKLIHEPGQWKNIWTRDYWYDARHDWINRDLLYRPMAVSTYRLVRQVFGPDAWPQHATNIALNALASALVVMLGVRFGLTREGATAAGVLFAVLPIHSEVIANIVGRADLLATCGMVSVLIFQRNLLIANRRKKITVWGVLIAMTAFVAMSAKESAVALAGLAFVFDAFWLHQLRESAAMSTSIAARVDSRNSADAYAGRGELNSGSSFIREWISPSTALRLAWVIVPTIGYLALRYAVLGGQMHQAPAVSKTVNVLVDAPLWQRAIGVVQLWGMYWLKTVWPVVLNVTYSINGVRLATSLLEPIVLLGLLMLIGPAVIAWRSWRRGNKTIALLFVSMIVMYAPTSNGPVLLQVFFAERIWFLPSVFLVLMVGIGWMHWPPSSLRTLIALILVVGMMGRGWIRNFEWKNNETLYWAAHRADPEGVVAMLLHGHTLVRAERFDEGMAVLQRATEIDPGYTDVQRELGHTYLVVGRNEDALRHLQIANIQAPNHRVTLEGLEIASRRVAEASTKELEELRSAADQNPDDMESQLGLIRKLREMNLVTETMERLQQGDGRFAQSAAWQQEYGVTLVYFDRRDEAAGRYARAMALAPNDAKLMIEYAMLLLDRRKGDDLTKAREIANRASQLSTSEPTVFVCLAELAVLDGNVEAAIEGYRKAIRLLPASASQRVLFEQRLRALGG